MLRRRPVWVPQTERGTQGPRERSSGHVRGEARGARLVAWLHSVQFNYMVDSCKSTLHRTAESNLVRPSTLPAWGAPCVAR